MVHNPNKRDSVTSSSKKKPKRKAVVIQVAACYLHGGDQVDTRLLHEHHKVPQGYGGGDTQENRVWLCGSCHDHVHRIGQLLLGGNEGLAKDLMGQAFPYSPVTRQKLRELAEVAARAMREYVPQMGDTEDEDDLVIVQLHMPRSMHHKLKTLAGNHLNKKSTRKVGLYHYIMAVLRNHIKVAGVVTAKELDPKQLYVAAPTISPPETTEPQSQDLFDTSLYKR